MTGVQQCLLNPRFSGYKFVHAVSIQLINRMYSAIPEPAVRQAVSNNPCSLSYSVLRHGQLWRLDDFSGVVTTYIL